MFGSRDANVRTFWLKSAFFGPNFSRTEILTAKPMVVGCVQHYSTHFIKQLGKSLEPFFHKVQKTGKNVKICKKKCQKSPKPGKFKKIVVLTQFWPIFTQFF